MHGRVTKRTFSGRVGVVGAGQKNGTPPLTQNFRLKRVDPGTTTFSGHLNPRQKGFMERPLQDVPSNILKEADAQWMGIHYWAPNQL